MCGGRSIFQVCFTCCDLDVTKDVVRELEKEKKKTRGNNNGLLHVPSKRKEKKSNQEPLALARLFFITSNLLLPPTVYIWR